MWPFNRQKTPSTEETANMPEEVKEYYEAERREHLGLAWLLAFATLIITVGVVVGILFGGRWVYHKVHKPSGTTLVQANNESTNNSTSTQKAPATQPAAPATPSKPAKPAEPAKPAQPAPTQPAPTQSTPSKKSASSTPSSSSSSTSQSTTGSGKLSNTGPGDTLALFVVVSLGAAVLHDLYKRYQKTI